MCVCVCVCVCVWVGGGGCGGVCVYVYVCMGVVYSFCNDIWDILEGTDQRSRVASIVLGASAKFLHLRF